MAPPLAAPRFHAAALPLRLRLRTRPQKLPCWRRAARPNDEDYYLIDAPESIGDGFSFSGGKYTDGPSKSDEWFAQGRMVKAHPVYGNKGKAKDPIFGLTMGAESQSSNDVFRWFCVEAGSSSNPPVLFIHGFPSQAYSYRNVLPVVSDNYHAIAFDWLGFGFSDKPQPDYGFDYTLDEYTSSLESLINAVAPDKLSIVVQGYFAPIVVKYANEHQDKLNHLILVNPPITDKHAKLPSTLACFSNFLLGEIFSQDPLRASDKALTSSGPYMMKEEDAMVYRRPYLVSGSSGFALNAISRAMKKDLKVYIESMRNILSSDSWKTKTTVCWGLRDRWLNYDGVEDFCGSANYKILELPMAGHHVQEDRGEELGKLVKCILRGQNVPVQ
uniref:AB hydrolase-1 domain-containing protein n=1 Tax=Oryza nivara TaxID=4536 RepID=A0A0E0FXP1_ORYNI